MKKMHRLSYLLIIALLFNLFPVTTFGAGLKIVSIKNLSVSVNLNESYTLPKTVKAKVSDDSYKDVTVTWDKKTVDSSKVGSYTFKGKVIGYTSKVTLVVKVVEKKSKRQNIRSQ